MSLHRYQYIMPRGMSGESLVETLQGHGIRLLPQPPATVEREYYDSFDWRLYGAGLVLSAERVRNGQRLQLRSLTDGLDIVSVITADVPGFAHELPDGVLREHLLPLLKMRRLLPAVTLKCTDRCFNMLDDETKTVARVLIECPRVVTSTGARRLGLGERLIVVPVRGYPEPVRVLRDLFEGELGLVRMNGTSLEEALGALGRHPFDYSSKLKIALDKEVSVSAALRRIFAELLRMVEANEDGVRQDLDVEFLHDLRVAVRRTRSLLSQLKEILPRSCAHYRQEFAWLGAVTGPVRDLDVHLLGFSGYAAAVGAGHLADLDPLRDALRADRNRERCNLLEALASPRYRRLKKDWRARLESEDAPGWDAGEMQQSALPMATAAIRHRYGRVLKLGDALMPDSPDEEYHRLRKQCKKLRYLMESFASLYSGDEIRHLIRVLKGLQDNLGEFQDLCVQTEALRGYAERLNGNGERSARARHALEALSLQLLQRRQSVHGEFAAAWSKFAQQDNQHRFVHLFGEE